MQAVDLIIDGYEELREDSEKWEEYNDTVNESGEPEKLEDDIEITKIYLLPIKQQLKTQGKQLFEGIYGVEVKVNREVRLWRAEGATFATGIEGSGDISKITAKKVKEGTEVTLSLFELFYHVCDIQHGLNIKVADSEEVATFTMKQGKIVEGGIYPEMILRCSEDVIAEKGIITTEIDETGVVIPLDENDKGTQELLLEAQTLLNEIYPNNMYNKCKDIEGYIEGNKERFRNIMRSQAAMVIEEEAEECEDTDTDIEVIKDEEAYFEYLYGNAEYEGICESTEDINEYREIEGTASVSVENSEVMEDGETDLETPETSDIEGTDTQGASVASDDESETAVTDENQFKSLLAAEIEAMPLTGGIMSEEIGRELNEELLELVQDEKRVKPIDLQRLAARPKSEGLMADMLERNKERAEKLKNTQALTEEGIDKLVDRLNKNMLSVKDNTDIRKLIALAYRDEYKEIFGGVSLC